MEKLQSERYSWEFLVGVCHPDPISDQKKYHFLHPFSDLPSKIHTHFQTSRLGRSYGIITQIRGQPKNFFKCISNSLISSSFLFIWNWNDKYVHKTIPNSRLKWAKCIPLFQTKKAQKPYPLGTYLYYMAYIRVPPPPPTSKFTQISCHCFNFVYFKHQVNHRHTNIWSAVSLSFKQLKVKQKHRSKCWNHMVVYLNSPSLPYINILGSQGANFYVSCSILPTSWIKPRAGVTKDSKCLTPHVTRDVIMPQTVPLVCLWANQISCASNTLFVIKTDLREIIYPI